MVLLPSLSRVQQQQQQPALDAVSTWCRRWKVSLSVPMCSCSTFTLDVNQVAGKVKPVLSVDGQPLPFVLHPTFRGVTYDCQMTFSEHAAKVKKRLASRRQCLQAIAGKSHGCDRDTLRAVYVAHTRPVVDYGAALWLSHAAPSTAAKVEAEQNRPATPFRNVDAAHGGQPPTPDSPRGMPRRQRVSASDSAPNPRSSP
jgi:hypothetical protein